MAILTQTSGVSITNLNTGLVSTNEQSRPFLLAHTNGSLYAFWSEMDWLDGSTHKQAESIKMCASTDGGVTWGTVYEIATGQAGTQITLDHDIHAIQIDITSTSSDIGLVWSRTNWGGSTPATSLWRMVVGTDGSTKNSADNNPTLAQGMLPQVVLNAAGTGFVFYVYAGLNWKSGATPLTTVTNSFTKYTTTSTGSPTTNTIFMSSLSAGAAPTTLPTVTNGERLYDWSIIRLSDGYHLMAFAAETKHAPAKSVDATNAPLALGRSIRTDVYYSTSSDDGVNWSAGVDLTGYGSAAITSFTHIPSARKIRAIQRASGKVAIFFSEFDNELEIGFYTNPGGIGDNSDTPMPNGLVHLATNNKTCAISTITGTRMGITIHDWANALVARITTSTTPALPASTTVTNHIALSADQKYLAVATDKGIRVYDVSDNTWTNWTVVHTWDTGSTPSIRHNTIVWLEFDSSTNNKLYFGYGANTINSCFGGIIDDVSLTSSSTVTDMLCDNGASTIFSTGGCAVGANGVYIAVGTLLTGCNLAGTALGYTATLGANALTSKYNIAYNTTSGKVVVMENPSTTVGIQIFSDSGAAFTEAAYSPITNNSNPGITSGQGPIIQGNLTGSSRLIIQGRAPFGGTFDTSTGKNWWGFGHTRNLGWRLRSETSTCAYWTVWSGTALLIQSPYALHRFNTAKRGLIKVAEYTYSAGSLTTAGVNWYDAVKSTVSDQTKLGEHSFAEISGTLVGLVIKEKWETGFYLYSGRLLTEESLQTTTFTTYACVQKLIPQSLQLKADILQRVTRTFSMYAYRLGLTYQTFSSYAWLTRRQGGNPPDPLDPAWINWVDTRAYIKAYIKPPTAGTQTISLKAKVSPIRGFDLNTKAQIVAAYHLQMKANILPLWSQAEALVTYKIASSLTAQAQVQYYVTGASFAQNLTIGAYIVKQKESRLGIQYVIPAVTPIGLIPVSKVSVTDSAMATLSMKAKITHVSS